MTDHYAREACRCLATLRDAQQQASHLGEIAGDKDQRPLRQTWLSLAGQLIDLIDDYATLIP